MPKSVVSIDSFISDDSDDEEHRLAQQEWEESLEQLAQIVSVVLLPFLGKWLGRRWSYWGECLYPTQHCISREMVSLCTLRPPRIGKVILSRRATLPIVLNDMYEHCNYYLLDAEGNLCLDVAYPCATSSAAFFNHSVIVIPEPSMSRRIL
jgi:hypothetical protein